MGACYQARWQNSAVYDEDMARSERIRDALREQERGGYHAVDARQRKTMTRA